MAIFIALSRRKKVESGCRPDETGTVVMSFHEPFYPIAPPPTFKSQAKNMIPDMLGTKELRYDVDSEVVSQ